MNKNSASVHLDKIFFVASVFALLTCEVFAAAPVCTRQALSLPDSSVPVGTVRKDIPIEHIIIVMQENHSFDMHLGKLNKPEFYGSEVDGVSEQMLNFDNRGKPVSVFHLPSRCMVDTDHTWAGMHSSWNLGANDGFVKTNGRRVMGYFDETDLSYYYSLANQFTIADRYFGSVMSQTFPNRLFLMAGTAFGHRKNDIPISPNEFHQRSIFDVLNENKVTWRIYTNNAHPYAELFRPMFAKNTANVSSLDKYDLDLKNGNLPSVVFLDSLEDVEDEHPPLDVGIGESWVQARVESLMKSQYWKSSVLFLTYDENGALFDHVTPPESCTPEDAPWAADYDHYGFRVPLIAVSPWVKHHHVSHDVYDHTSILKFIETKFNLPALTRRDANADAMLDLFDFSNPTFEVRELPKSNYVSGRVCKPYL